MISWNVKVNYSKLDIFRVACGYLKLPEQALLHFKKLHSEDISDQVLMLDY